MGKQAWTGTHLIKGLAISEGKGLILIREHLIENIYREMPSKWPTIIKYKHHSSVLLASVSPTFCHLSTDEMDELMEASMQRDSEGQTRQHKKGK